VRLDDLPVVRNVPTVTAAQMAEVDRITIEELHIPVDVLMENAGRQIAAAVRAVLGGSVAGKRVIGLVGSGNNGGDAVAALRHLVNWGALVCAELAASQERMRESTRTQIGRLLLATTADPV
jgi:NAD(P)H-hydrate repair Nnr-like enzyme with NAD(P)H-hydrate epimerase domain